MSSNSRVTPRNAGVSSNSVTGARSRAATPLDVSRAPCAADPPKAHYRRHLDSYGGEDIPRLLTLLLYLAWEPQCGGELRLHGVEGADGANHRDVAPRPGRLVIFFSQEVEHEVLPSEGERLAVTLWIWDQKRDRYGR